MEFNRVNQNHNQETFFAPTPDAMRSKIVEFAKASKTVAEDILHPGANANYSSSTEHHYYHHHHYNTWYSPFYSWNSPWFWSSPRPVYVVQPNQGESNRKKNDNSGLFLAIGIVGAITAVVGSYFLGKDIAKYQNSDWEVKENTEFKHLLQGYSSHNQNGSDQAVVSSAMEIANLRERIHLRERDSASFNLATKITGLASTVFTSASGFMLYSGVIHSTLPLYLGGAGIAVSLAASLLKWGYDTASSYNRLDAQSINREVKYLNQALAVTHIG